MVKIFQTELDRMLVPAARELHVRLELPEGVALANTWGYRHEIQGNTVTYYLPTLHNGDYETMFAEIAFAAGFDGGTVGEVWVDYLDLENAPKSMGPYPVAVRSGSRDDMIADPRVREAEAC